jgi:SH3 domain-containing YSC84-like protein 1
MFLARGTLGVPLVRAQSDEQVVVDRAQFVVNDTRHDKEFGNAHDLLHHARAVMIVPWLYKGGVFVGGGTGALLARRPGGGWSEPVYYAIGSASFDLQFGVEQSEMVLFVMSQKSLDTLMRDQYKLGAQAGIAVVTLGSNVEA